jgi:serine/threonine-protein kinase
VHDYGETVHDGVPMPYIVMEMVSGDTLAARLAGPGLEWPGAAAVCADVAAAMAAAHARGLVHRDIKPGNIMLSEAGVKVVDFGLAAPCGTDPAVDGQLWGTPAYLAPEQLDSGQAVPAGDVYAFGVLLYECFAGRPPWPGSTAPEVLEQRRRTPAPAWPGPPDAIAELYHNCLSPEPHQRPSASEAELVLRRAAAAAAQHNGITRTADETSAVRPPLRSPTAVTATRAVPLRGWKRLSRRIVVVTSVPAAIAAGLLAAQLSGLGPAEEAAQGVPADDTPSATATWCKTLYTSKRLADGTFAARLTVANLGQAILRDWSVGFTTAAGQQIAEARNAAWTQERRHVVLTTQHRLAPGGTVTMSLQGTFDTTQDGIPTGFALNGARCDTATQVSMSPTPIPHAATTQDSPRQGSTRSTPAQEDRSPDRSPVASPTRTEGSVSPPPETAGTRPPASSAVPSTTPASGRPATPDPSPTVTSSVPAGPPQNDPTGLPSPSTDNSHADSSPAATAIAAGLAAIGAPADSVRIA